MDVTLNAATIAFFAALGGVLAGAIAALWRELLKSKNEQIASLIAENKDLKDVAWKSLAVDQDRFQRLEAKYNELLERALVNRNVR